MKQELSVQDAITIARIHGAKWIALDVDKDIFICGKNVDISDIYVTKKYECIGKADSNWPDWKDSLIEVHQVDCDKCVNSDVCYECKHNPDYNDYFEVKDETNNSLCACG